MKIIIQCAGSKAANAGSLTGTMGKLIKFVANPSKAPHSDKYLYAKPDDISDNGKTWRERIWDYNHHEKTKNPNQILPAYQLYTNPAYKKLVKEFGIEKIFILSAGWGLIPADFLTPMYDITFSSASDGYTKRKKIDKYLYYNMLPNDCEDIIFLGGKSYLPMFCSLTETYAGNKSIYFNSTNPPAVPKDFKLVQYNTTTRTNWHYQCALSIIAANSKYNDTVEQLQKKGKT